MSDNQTEQQAPDTQAADSAAAPRFSRVLAGFGILAAFAACVALAIAVYGPTRITLNGSTMIVPRTATVSYLAAQGVFAGPHGDLRALSGRVLAEGAGGAPTVLMDGAAAAADAALAAGAQLTTVRGADVVETTTVRTIETTPALRYVGSGSFESVEDSGTPSIVRVVLGSVSGEEQTRTVVSPGTPMTVRREPDWKGPKEVALTFDDGPWRGSTDEVLRQLRAADAKATFFVIGNRLHGGGAAIEKRVLAAGMEIGNHSLSHKLLGHAPRKTVKKQILRGSQAIERVLGVRPRWFRPPGGSTSATVRKLAKRYGQRTILWSIDPKDWQRPSPRVISRRILDRIRPGSVVLMHDGGGDRANTREALKAVLRGLKARGYSMVTLSALHDLPELREPPHWSDLPALLK